MLDYGWVNSRLAVGGQLKGDKDRLKQLVDAGITHIVCAQQEMDDTLLIKLNAPSIRYLRVPTWDDHTTKPNEWFEKVINFVLPALALPGSKVYIHCAAGISRSTSLTYAVLRAQGWSSNTALGMVVRARPQAQINYKSDADRAVRELGFNDGY